MERLISMGKNIQQCSLCHRLISKTQIRTQGRAHFVAIQINHGNLPVQQPFAQALRQCGLAGAGMAKKPEYFRDGFHF